MIESHINLKVVMVVSPTAILLLLLGSGLTGVAMENTFASRITELWYNISHSFADDLFDLTVPTLISLKEYRSQLCLLS